MTLAIEAVVVLIYVGLVYRGWRRAPLTHRACRSWRWVVWIIALCPGFSLCSSGSLIRRGRGPWWVLPKGAYAWYGWVPCRIPGPLLPEAWWKELDRWP